MREHNTVTVVVFVAPRSPVKMKTGKGPRRRIERFRSHDGDFELVFVAEVEEAAPLASSMPSLDSPFLGFR